MAGLINEQGMTQFKPSEDPLWVPSAEASSMNQTTLNQTVATWNKTVNQETTGQNQLNLHIRTPLPSNITTYIL